ncbi:MAG: globin [Planctomycetales bacterium]|nr:globin [Planctomycetales bacterium]
MPLAEHQVFERVGVEGFARLSAAFYRQIPEDPVLGPMYPPEDLVGAESRLRDFLIYRFGGPQTYIEQRGHPRLRLRHMPFKIDQSARERWMLLMSNSLDETQLDSDATEVLRTFFDHMSNFLINHE